MLPITEFLPQVSDYFSQNLNLVLQAEPGAGKSTALPLSLIGAEWLSGKKILMLEPRRVAAKSIAFFIAQQLGERVGGRVGYHVKNDRNTSADTQLEIVTEGILTRRIQNDPELADVGLIIFDEVHERSLHTDLALMLALEVQQTIREDLKLLVMSATIDTEVVSDYLGGAHVISCPGRAFPVSVEYLPAATTFRDKPLLHIHVAKALSTLFKSQHKGDILVFLPGKADINRCLSEAKNVFKESHSVVLLPLYGGLSMEQQERALLPDPNGLQRVIFTTNIAETSLTIEGVTCVIDSGLEKVSLYDPVSGMTRLDTVSISKASAEQRKGRAGRVQQGHCIRLWSQQHQQTLREYQSEEVVTADLTNLVLELFAWGLPDYHDINWLTPPPLAHFEAATEVLSSLGLINEEGHITALGTQASALGMHPRLSAMLLKAASDTEKGIACELAALISENDIFQGRRGVDIVERLIALEDYKRNKQSACQAWPLNQTGVTHVIKATKSLQRRLDMPTKATEFSLTDLHLHVGKLLLTAYPDRLAKKRSANEGRYQLANGRGVLLFEDDPLFGADWLVVSDCNAHKKEGHIFSACSIEWADILNTLEPLFEEDIIYRLDDKKQHIIGRRMTRYQAITLSVQPLSDIPPDAFQQCLKEVLAVEGMAILNWTDQCENWLSRAAWLGSIVEEFPSFSKDSLAASADQWLLPYITHVKSLSHLKKINIYALMAGSLSWDQQQQLEREAPEVYVTPSQKKITITYDKHQGPTVSVRLQEMFGEVESPKIGGNKVPLRFELLSPAQRPIQTTSDLANFWNTSYFEVAKEMRGKYPRHRWPDKPLLETAGHSIKHRRR